MKASSQNKLIEKLSYWLIKDRPPRRAYLCDFNRIIHEVRPADVLLIEGRNRIGTIIRHVTQSPWTHAVLCIGHIHDVEDPVLRKAIKRHYQGPMNTQLLIEAILGEGTIVSPITKYKDDHIRICRPTGLSHPDAQAVINYAIQQLGKKYNVRHVFDLFRFLFPWSILPRKWRSSLFSHNAMQPTEDICSSMIAAAFNSVHFPILPLVKMDKKEHPELVLRNPKLFTPSDFDYSPYFSIIKYPIFELSHASAYRSLPWKEGVLSNDEAGLYVSPEISTPELNAATSSTEAADSKEK